MCVELRQRSHLCHKTGTIGRKFETFADMLYYPDLHVNKVKLDATHHHGKAVWTLDILGRILFSTHLNILIAMEKIEWDHFGVFSRAQI